MPLPQVPAHIREQYKGKRALITGGMGFIGSNLAIALTELGTKVTIVDAMLPGYGGNLFNIAPVQDAVTVNFSDIRDLHIMNYLVDGQDFVFHLAGQMDHVLSLTNPFPDIDINIKGTTVLLEACKHVNPSVRFVYSGTRGEYGKVAVLPVKEDAPLQPTGIHEVSRLAAEKIVQIYHSIHGIQSVMLRLTNIYGPRAQMKHSRYGVANWFVRLAVDNEVISIFGDGQIKRDFLHVDDCVAAMIMSGVTPTAYGDVFNVGVDHPSTFLELAEEIIAVAGTGKWEFTPFSPERKAQEPGDFYSDITKIQATVGWSPTTSLNAGLRETIEYYRAHKSYYW